MLNSAAYNIIDSLIARGVTMFFGIPGGPVCPVFEALRIHPGATLIESRHENHAAFAAAAYYKTTGKTAGVILTAGPGITNSISGIASAYAESASMVVIAGDVAWNTHGGRLAQNSGPEGLDAESILSSITCQQTRVTNGRSAVSQAISCLDSSIETSKPSLLVLPIDCGNEKVSPVSITPYKTTKESETPTEVIESTATMLRDAKYPLLVIGGGCKNSMHLVSILVDLLNVPFITTPRAKGFISETHPLSLRNGGMAASMWAREYTSKPIDVVLAIGTDLDDTSVGPTPYLKKGGFLIHVDKNASVFNRNFPVNIGITSDIKNFCQKLSRFITDNNCANKNGKSIIKDIVKKSPFDIANCANDNGSGSRIPPHRAIIDVQRALNDAVFVSDIGEHMLFALHYLTIKTNFHIQLDLGSMGSGIAGAIGVALGERLTSNRPVICICGDGGMHMSGMEILTAAKLKLPIVYAVFNDSRYNMVHHGMKQIFGEAEQYDTQFVDFSKWASSMGINSEVINKGGQISGEQLKSYLKEGPVLLDIRTDPSIRVSGGGRVEALQHMSMLSEGKS